MKTCALCKCALPLHSFGIARSNPDGLNRKCRECCRASLRKYRHANPERNREHQRKWRTKNRERERLRARQRSAGNGRLTYLVAAVGTALVKIGTTTKNPKSRLGNLQTGSPVPLTMLCTTPTPESDLHQFFADERQHGEWFRKTPVLKAFVEYVKAHGKLPPRNEWFYLDPR